MLKKTTLAILGLAVSSFASAGMYSTPPVPAACVPGDVTVPCAASKWNIGVQALYLKPVYDADKGYDYSSTTRESFKELDGKWGWGYRLEGSYHFNTGNDITATLIHYDVNTNRSGYVGATPFSLSGVPYNLFLDNKFDQVNLVMGQHTDIGMRDKARFYGGMQYADIRVYAVNTFTTTPLAIAPLATAGFSQYRDTEFTGFGPVVGINYGYDLTQHLSLTANTAGSILFGSSRYSTGYVLAPSGLVLSDVYASKKTMVPSFEAKLGVNYVHELAQGILNFEGGYQVVDYFNALQTKKITGIGVPTNSNFGLFGPYFGVKWLGNA